MRSSLRRGLSAVFAWSSAVRRQQDHRRLPGDPTYGEIATSQLPRPIVDQLRHDFLTYKVIPGDQPSVITVDPVYGAMEARGILTAARTDYAHAFPADAFLAKKRRPMARSTRMPL